jgi:hypothetical protein
MDVDFMLFQLTPVIHSSVETSTPSYAMIYYSVSVTGCRVKMK